MPCLGSVSKIFTLYGDVNGFIPAAFGLAQELCDLFPAYSRFSSRILPVLWGESFRSHLCP